MEGFEAYNLYLNKEVILFLNDSDGMVKRRDGILTDYNDHHLFLKLTQGNKKGETVAFLITDIKRIEPKNGDSND